MKNTLLLFFIIGCGLIAFGQNCRLTISGQVFDGSPDHPLGYANVFLEEAGEGVPTNEQGEFRLEGICAGDYHLRVTHLGCHPERLFLRLQADTIIQIALAHHAELLEGVEVTEERHEHFGESRQALGLQALEEGAGQNLAKLIETISGVSSIRNGSGISKPVIHGLSGNRIAILNNGIVQAGQQWGVDHAPEIDPFTADRITVIKGVDGIAYGGNTLGGAVLIEPGRIENDPHLHGAVQYLLHTNGRQHALSTRLEKSGRWADWRIVGTIKQGGDHHTPDYFLRNTGLRERNIAGQLQKNIGDQWFHTIYYSFFNTELGILRGSHISNTTDLEVAIGRAEPFFTLPDYKGELEEPRQKVQHHLLKYNSKYYLNDEHSLQFTYAGQVNRRREFDIRRGDRSNRPALDLQLQAHFVDLFWQVEKGAVKRKLGAQFRVNENKNQPDTGVLPLIPDYDAYTPSLYYIWSYRHRRSRWQVGGRYDYVTMDVATISRDLPRRVERFSHQFHNYSLALAWQQDVSDHWATKVNTGLVKRSPEVNELYSMGLHQGVASIEEGNAQLETEWSLKSTWTNNFHFGDRFFVETTLYYQLIRDFIFLAPQEETRLTIRGAFPVFNYNQTNARIAGLDVSSKFAFHEKWEWENNYAIVRGYDQDNEQPLVYMPADNLRSTLTFTGNDSKCFQSPNVSINGLYVWKQTRLLASQDLLSPPAAYFLLSLSAGTAMSWSGKTLHLSIQLENLLNERYRDYLNRLRYYADEEGRNFRINLRFKF